LLSFCEAANDHRDVLPNNAVGLLPGCVYSVLTRSDGFVDGVCADAKEQDLWSNANSDNDRRTGREFLRFGHRAAGRDRGDLVGAEVSEQQVIEFPRRKNIGIGAAVS